MGKRPARSSVSLLSCRNHLPLSDRIWNLPVACPGRSKCSALSMRRELLRWSVRLAASCTTMRRHGRATSPGLSIWGGTSRARTGSRWSRQDASCDEQGFSSPREAMPRYTIISTCSTAARVKLAARHWPATCFANSSVFLWSDAQPIGDCAYQIHRLSVVPCKAISGWDGVQVPGPATRRHVSVGIGAAPCQK